MNGLSFIPKGTPVGVFLFPGGVRLGKETPTTHYGTLVEAYGGDGPVALDGCQGRRIVIPATSIVFVKER